MLVSRTYKGMIYQIPSFQCSISKKVCTFTKTRIEICILFFSIANFLDTYITDSTEKCRHIVCSILDRISNYYTNNSLVWGGGGGLQAYSMQHSRQDIKLLH